MSDGHSNDVNSDQTPQTKTVSESQIMKNRISKFAEHAVDHWTSSDGNVTEAIIFPSPTTPVYRSKPSWVNTTALLRLKDDSIWLITINDHPWTAAQIQTVAAKLLTRDEGDTARISLRQAVSRVLDLKYYCVSSNLVLPVMAPRRQVYWLDTIKSNWGVVGYVVAMRRSGEQIFDPTYHNESEHALIDSITRHLTLFLENVDPVAGLATTSPVVLNILTYNYLVNKRHACNRQQFAKTFPLLMSAVTRPESFRACEEDICAEKHLFPLLIWTITCPGEFDSFDHGLSDLIDNSIDFSADLSKAWGVAPRVFRYLAGLPTAVVGTEWDGHGRQLAVILDHLPTATFPTGADDWAAFNCAIRIAARRSQTCISHLSEFEESMVRNDPCFAWAFESHAPDLLFSAVLSEGFAKWKKGNRNLETCFANDHVICPSIKRLQLCVKIYLRSELARVRPGFEVGNFRLWRVATDTLVSLLRQGKLVEISQQFDQQLEPLIDRADSELRLIYGREVLPLLPVEFLSSSGNRRVRSIRSDHEFCEFSHALSLSQWQNPRWFDRLRSGASFTLGVIDSKSGGYVSMASIDAIRCERSERWQLRETSHLGHGYSDPGSECSQVIKEVLEYCEQPHVQREIDMGQRLWSALQKDEALWPRRVADHPAFFGALTTSLGKDACESAVQRVLGTLTTLRNHRV